MTRIVIFLIFSWQVCASESVQKVVYLKNIFGHIHQNPRRHSRAITTVSCGYPIKVIKREEGERASAEGWYRVEAGTYKGFVRVAHTSEKKEPCFQEKYPRFFDRSELGPTDYYRWARLQELLLRGVSKDKP